MGRDESAAVREESAKPEVKVRANVAQGGRDETLCIHGDDFSSAELYARDAAASSALRRRT